MNRIIHRLPKSTGLTTGNDFVVIKAKLDMKVKEPDSQLKGNLMRPFIHSFNTCALGSYVPGSILDPYDTSETKKKTKQKFPIPNVILELTL